MKKGLSFIENEHLFNFVLSTMYFNEAKKEKEIFELWRKGYNNCDIAKQVGYTEGTIRNRKKDLVDKINDFLLEDNYTKTKYCVYKHIFPNNKIYVGMTKDIKKRWAEGQGYINNENMNKAIIKYGWDNIKHIIIQNNLTFEEAHKLENEKIQEYKSYIPQYGYNIDVIIEEENK